MVDQAVARGRPDAVGRGRGRGRSILTVQGGPCPPEVTLVLRLVGVCVLLRAWWQLTGVFLPFTGGGDRPSGEALEVALRLSALVLALLLALNVVVPAAAFALGCLILGQVAASHSYYENNRTFTGLVLVLGAVDHQRGLGRPIACPPAGPAGAGRRGDVVVGDPRRGRPGGGVPAATDAPVRDLGGVGLPHLPCPHYPPHLRHVLVRLGGLLPCLRDVAHGATRAAARTRSPWTAEAGFAVPSARCRPAAAPAP